MKIEQGTMKNTAGVFETKSIVLMGLLIAMSVVGSYIKIPNPITGSIAMDSFPAFIGALVLGGIPGAIIGFFAHMVSAALTGFPLSLPIHLLVGMQMAVIMFVYSLIARKWNVIVASIVAVVLNGVAAPACFILIPNMGIPVFGALLVPLLVGSTLNVVVSGIVFKAIQTASILKQQQDH